MPMRTRDVRITWPDSDELERVPFLPLTASTTDRPIPEDVRATVWAVSHASLVDDLVIAVEVRERDARDTGERILLEDFMREQGFDPEEFPVE